MKSRGLLLLLLCCVASVAALLSEGAQAALLLRAVTRASSGTSGLRRTPPLLLHQPSPRFCLVFIDYSQYGVTPSSLQPQECGGRCAVTAYRKPCLFFCRKCCAARLCVPAGTYGNKASCPCYNNWKTKRGGPKCP